MHVQFDSECIHWFINFERHIFLPFFEGGEEILLDLCVGQEYEISCILSKDL